MEGMLEEPREHLTQLQAKAAKQSGRVGSAKRSKKGGMFPPVKAESPERHARSPPRNTPTETSDPTLWPEMYVKPIWLTMTMLGGRSREMKSSKRSRMEAVACAAHMVQRMVALVRSGDGACCARGG